MNIIYYKKFLPSITSEQLISIGFAKGWYNNEYRYYKDGLIAQVNLPDTTIYIKHAEWWYPCLETKKTIYDDLKNMEQYMIN